MEDRDREYKGVIKQALKLPMCRGVTTGYCIVGEGVTTSTVTTTNPPKGHKVWIDRNEW